MSINLKKTLQKVVNTKGLNGQKAQVVLCLDYSGSMDELYRSGFVQRLVERIVPVAVQFDDNGEMELYLFQNGCKKHPSTINEKNVDGLIKREIYGKYQFGGTAYAPAVKMICEDFEPGKSFFSGQKPVDPVYVIFITDGENSDHFQAESIIKAVCTKPVFFQFVGIGNATFSFLDKLDTLSGREIDNANFFQINDLDRVSDEELYEKLLTEFPQWLNVVKSRGIVKE